MLHRNHWLLAALLLPLLLLFGSNGGASGLTGEQWLGSGSSPRYLEGNLFDHRHAKVAGVIEQADEEEGPPRHAYQAATSVLWPRDERPATGHEMAPGRVGGSPIACAARPRAPPARF